MGASPAAPTGAVRDLPAFRDRRATPPRLLGTFPAQLAAFSGSGTAPRPSTTANAPQAGRGAQMTGRAAAPLDTDALRSPLPLERAAILAKAETMLGVPYVWGGDDAKKGLDCSSFLSRAWGIARQTTDTLSKVADPIGKDELRAGDAMNLPTWKDPQGYGHVRMFDRWANPEKTKMWVYEETTATGFVVHRQIDYDPKYQPMRLRGLD